MATFNYSNYFFQALVALFWFVASQMQQNVIQRALCT